MLILPAGFFDWRCIWTDTTGDRQSQICNRSAAAKYNKDISIGYGVGVPVDGF
jgi:hypothetical protein